MFAAAIIFFTRLPLWRYVDVPSDHFKRVIYFWPFAGWITSIFMVLVLLLSSTFLPSNIAIILTLLSRVLLTGALHEDGLADFMDGFGGGRSKDRILIIMKDSHAGTYAIVGLIFYFLLLFAIMQSLPLLPLILMILIADPFCKMVSSFITARLAYARTLEASKIQAIYSRPTSKEIQTTLFFGLLPLVLILPFLPSYWLLFALIAPILVFFLLTSWMKYKIEGYTGDCAGALVLLLELSFMLTYIAIYTQII